MLRYHNENFIFFPVVYFFNYTLKRVEDNSVDKILETVSSEDVQTAMKTCDTKLATKVLKAAGLPPELMKRVQKKYDTAHFYESWGIKI